MALRRQKCACCQALAQNEVQYGMDSITTEHRLTELEIKASFTEDLVEQLNQVVIRQQQQIDLLVRELTDLKQLQRDSGSGEFRGLRDERPPHY